MIIKCDISCLCSTFKSVFEHFEDRLHGFSLIVFLPKLVSIKKMYFQYLVVRAVAVRAWQSWHILKMHVTFGHDGG